MIKTVEEIYREMCGTFQARTGRQLRDDGDMAVRLYAAAAQIYSLYAYNEWVSNQCFPQTATGEYLDYHGQIRGLTRKSALYAGGNIQFSIPAPLKGDVQIEAGTVCMTGTGLRFETTENGTIKAGELSCTIPARAQKAGETGNVAAGTIVFMTAAPVGVSDCNNIAAFTGGADEEDDESFRVRILSSFRQLPNGANAAYYEKEALGIDGVTGVRVLPKRRGLGTVDVIITGENGMPTEELIDTVRKRFEETREICVKVSVLAPKAVPLNVTAKIDVAEGYTFEEVSAKVTEAIQNYFNGSLLGENVLMAKLGSIIFSVEGVSNYSLLAPEADLKVKEDELPRAGTIKINKWS